MTNVSHNPKKVKVLTNYPASQRPLGDLMREAQFTLVRYLERALRDAGIDDIGAAHASVMGMVDPNGDRLATLVLRGGRTKQATAELTAQLVRRGYLRVVADPSDGRAKLHLPTDAGRALLRVCESIILEYEAWLESVLGVGELDKLRVALLTICGHGAPAPVDETG